MLWFLHPAVNGAASASKPLGDVFCTPVTFNHHAPALLLRSSTTITRVLSSSTNTLQVLVMANTENQAELKQIPQMKMKIADRNPSICGSV